MIVRLMSKHVYSSAILLSCALNASALAQEQGKQNRVEVVGHVLQPAAVQPSDERLAQIKLPPGFTITRFAKDLLNTRALAVDPKSGAVYVSRREQQDVLMLQDKDGDGVAEIVEPVAQRPQLHGIAIADGIMYLVGVRDLYSARIKSDGRLEDLERIMDDLPDAGQHHNRTLAVGPDKMLYISCGSTTNAAEEPNPEAATMVRATLDGKSRTIFASGLRNTIGFGWHPTTKQLWGMDNGIDWLGDDAQREELNEISQGKRYGWPFIYADGKFQPERQPNDGTSQEEWRKLSTEPALLYTAHAAPMQLAFYSGTMFPEAYRNDAFVTMRGSWNRDPPSGYEIVRIHFDDNGRPEKIEPFATGWLTQNADGTWSQMGRLFGCAVAKDGALLVSDDKNGMIYRIAYRAPAGRE